METLILSTPSPQNDKFWGKYWLPRVHLLGKDIYVRKTEKTKKQKNKKQNEKQIKKNPCTEPPQKEHLFGKDWKLRQHLQKRKKRQLLGKDWLPIPSQRTFITERLKPLNQKMHLKSKPKQQLLRKDWTPCKKKMILKNDWKSFRQKEKKKTFVRERIKKKEGLLDRKYCLPQFILPETPHFSWVEWIIGRHSVKEEKKKKKRKLMNIYDGDCSWPGLAFLWCCNAIQTAARHVVSIRDWKY